MTQTHAQRDLRTRLDEIRNRINSAATRAGRSPQEITLIAVTKTHPVAILRDALAAGATDLGENRVQDAEPKILALGRHATRWHLIGHLQANKARRAVKLFDVIHSIDSVGLVARLDRLCIEEGRSDLPVLIQVDLAGETTKSGVSEAALAEVAEAISGCENLRLEGLMVLPPFYDDVEKVRPYFGRLKELRDKLKSAGHFGECPGQLSMGMTHDFEVAVEEGATMVRIGTAIFGDRNAQH